MGSRPRKRKDKLQAIELRPIHLGLLAASLQGLEPHALNQVVELVHCSVVEDEAVVAVVPAQDLTQPGMLFGHRYMPPPPQLQSKLFQLASHPRRLRLPLDDELSTSSGRTVMCEPQEVECLWSSQTRPCSLSGSKTPKLDESGLALIELQAEFGQPLPECLQQPSCVAFVLGSNDAIIGIAHDHDLAVR